MAETDLPMGLVNDSPTQALESVALVVAMAENGVIGRDGALPWRLPDELKYFKRLTVGHTLIMGRKTYLSIGRPLPRRRTLVLSRSADFAADGIDVVPSLVAAFSAAGAAQHAPHGPTIFAVGGSSVYAEALPYAGHLFLTRVHAQVAGDVCFPPVDWQNWALQGSEHHDADDRHAHAFTMEHYARRPAHAP